MTPITHHAIRKLNISATTAHSDNNTTTENRTETDLI
jgi:hypothetical protein